MMHDADLLEELMLHEELDRLEAQRSILAFYMRMTGFMPPRHLKVIVKLLEAMDADRIDRAMLFAPPRHIKSLMATTLFPAWLLGKYPNTKIMSVVHTQHYAAKIGRNVRNLLRHRLWPWPEVQLAGDSQQKEQWATGLGGEYNGFGAIGGNQHGNPAEWLFMDDIVKGRKIAMSAHMREEIWETYKTDLLSRLQGRRKQLMVFTRWHMDDPAGRILPDDFNGKTGWYADKETGEKWFVLSLPAVAEHENDPLKRKPGEWLWPEAFGEKQLGGVRRRGGWVWSALFQQRPSPEEGLMFTADHIQRYSPGKLDLTALQIYGSSDYAVTEKETQKDDPDFTVHMVWGVDRDLNVYLLDLWRGRTQSDQWVMHWMRLVKKWKPLRWFEEQGQIIRAMGPLINTTMEQESTYVDRVQMTSGQDKSMRAQVLLGWSAMGKLFLPEHAELPANILDHLNAFETELLQFPTGRHDDTVDAATLFARGLDRIIAGEPPRKKQRSPHGDTLDDLWSRHEQEMNRRQRRYG
jgi:predicted phage terminase large subunit-like protein